LSSISAKQETSRTRKIREVRGAADLPEKTPEPTPEGGTPMRWRKRSLLLVAAVLLLPPLLPWPGSDDEPAVGAASATSGATCLLRSSVVGVGGSPGETEGMRSNGTIGQPTPVGVGTSGGKVLYAGFWDRIPLTSAVEEDESLEGFAQVFETHLFQNTPNPFNPVTTIGYSVREEGPVDLTIFSVEGEHIRTLVHRHRQPGLFSAVWDGKDESGRPVSSGVYFYRMTTDNHSEVRRMLVLK
jgi:hypothetical protein